MKIGQQIHATSTLLEAGRHAIVEVKTILINLHNGVPGKKMTVALESNEEEADTKVFLFAEFAITLGISSITIVIVDSDIDILASFYSLYLEMQMVLQLGSASTISDLDISATTGFHAFTGCDSTSAFAWKGKFKCLKIPESDERFLDAFSILGEQQDVNQLKKSSWRIYLQNLW